MSTDIRTHIEAFVSCQHPPLAQITCGTPPCYARIPMRSCRSCRCCFWSSYVTIQLTLPRSRKFRICCLDVQLYCLSISSSEIRPPPHRKLSSTIPKKASKTCNLHMSWPAVTQENKRTSKQLSMRPCQFPVLKLVSKYYHRPNNEADCPNPKIISPWRGPYTVRALMSPVIYRVTKDGNPPRLRSTLTG